MRKKMIYAFTAAAVLTMTAVQPMTALAANGTYMISGNCQNKVVPGGNNCLNIEGLLGNWNLNCGQNTNSQKPGNQNTSTQKPGQNVNNGNQGSGSSTGSNQESASQDAWVQQVVNLVNEERAKAGLSALKVNQGVTSAAQVRAGELVSSFSHTRPNGSNFSTALKDAGVSYQGVGENIAYGQSSPEAVMKQWMNSSGHRANILSPDFTEIGVGHYESASGVHYWTQLFIR